MSYQFPIELTPDDNGTFLVTCPLLPEVTSFGESEEDAIEHGRAAVAEAVAARLARFQVIPEAAEPARGPSVTIPLRLQPKVALMSVMAFKRMTRADLARATGWSRTSVDRLFDPGHNSRLEKFEEAFRAAGSEPSFTVEAPRQAG